MENLNWANSFEVNRTLVSESNYSNQNNTPQASLVQDGDNIRLSVLWEGSPQLSFDDTFQFDIMSSVYSEKALLDFTQGVFSGSSGLKDYMKTENFEGQNLNFAPYKSLSYLERTALLDDDKLEAYLASLGTDLYSHEITVNSKQLPAASFSQSGHTFDAETGVLVLFGSDFTSVDINELDWSKFSWDVDETGENTIFFQLSFIDEENSQISSDTELQVTLSAFGLNELLTADNFGGKAETGGIADRFNIESGFLKNSEGVISIEPLAVLVNQPISFADEIMPTLLKSGDKFFSASPDAGYRGTGGEIVITATVNEDMKAGTSFLVTLNTGAVVRLSRNELTANEFTGTYTIAADDPDVAELLVTSYAPGNATDLSGNTLMTNIDVRDYTDMENPSIPDYDAGARLGNIVIDRTAPALTAFSATPNSGALGTGDAIVITATVAENMQAGTGFKVTLNTGAEILLTRKDLTANEFMGTYTIAVEDTDVSDLLVSSYEIGDAVDIAGKALVADTDISSFSDLGDIIVDRTIPALISFSATPASGAKETDDEIVITATVSEDMQADTSFDVTLNTGAVVSLVRDSSTATDFTGTYTVAVEDTDVSDLMVSSYEIGDAVDIAGKALVADTDISGFSDLGDIIVDLTAPTLTGFSAAPNSGTFATGDEIVITAIVSEDMQADTSFDVTLNTGAVVSLVRDSSTATDFTGTYTVAVEDTDVSDLLVSSYEIGDAVDIAGKALVADTDISSFSDLGDITVDSIAPTLIGFSAAPNSGAMETGDEVAITAIVSEDMQADTSFDVTLNTGAVVSLVRDSSTATDFTGTYTVAVEDTDVSDLMVSSYELGDAVDIAGNALIADTDISSFSDLGDIIVDRTIPALIGFSATPASGAKETDDEIVITAIVSEDMQADTSFDVTLNTGAVVSLVRDSSTATDFTGTYTVAVEDTDVSDLMVSSYELGDAVDIAGNALIADTDISSFSDLGDIIVDRIAPTLTGFSAAPNSGTFATGDEIVITAIVSEDMQADTSFDVTLNTGAVVSLVRDSSTATDFTGTYTVAVEDTDVSDLMVSSYELGDAVDIAGKALVADTDISGFSDLGDIIVDLTAPTLTGFSAAPNSGTFATGDEIVITAIVSEDMQADTSFDVTLNTGAVVSLVRDSSTATDFTGTYTVAVEDTDVSDLMVSSYELGDAVDIAGNALIADTDISSFSDLGDIIVDRIAPTLTGFSAAPNSGTFATGDEIVITAIVSEDMQADTSFDVTLNTGAVVSLVRDSSTATDFTGTYTVAVEDTDVSDLMVSSYELGDAVDIAGNALIADTDISSFSDLGDIIVDRIAPTLTGFSAAPNSGTFATGDEIVITAIVSEDMQADTSFDVTLNTGAVVSLVRDSSTATDFTGTYTVAVEDTDVSDLMVSSYELGDAVDIAGKALVADTDISGFSDLGDIIVDLTAPTLTGFSAAPNSGTFATGDEIVITAIVSEDMQADTSFDVTLNTGAVVSLVRDSSTATDFTGTYTVAVEDTDVSDLMVSSYELGDAVDIAGNALIADTDISSFSDLGDIIVDLDPTTINIYNLLEIEFTDFPVSQFEASSSAIAPLSGTVPDTFESIDTSTLTNYYVDYPWGYYESVEEPDFIGKVWSGDELNWDDSTVIVENATHLYFETSSTREGYVRAYDNPTQGIGYEISEVQLINTGDDWQNYWQKNVPSLSWFDETVLTALDLVEADVTGTFNGYWMRDEDRDGIFEESGHFISFHSGAQNPGGFDVSLGAAYFEEATSQIRIYDSDVTYYGAFDLDDTTNII